MALFGNARRPGAPMDLEAVMGANGAYEVQPSDLSSAPPQGFSIAAGTPPRTMFGGGPAMSSGMGADEQRQRIAALRQQESQGYSPAQLRAIGVGEMPGRPAGGGGLFGAGGRNFLRGAGKVLQTVGEVAAFGPYYGAYKQQQARAAEDRQWEMEQRDQQRQEWQRPKLFNTGEAVVAIGPDMQPRTVFQDQPRRSEQERLFEMWSAEADPARKAMLGRMIRGFQYTPEWQQTRIETAGETAEAQAEARARFRAPPRAPAAKPPTVNNVMASVVERWLAGEPLSAQDQDALKWYRSRGGKRGDRTETAGSDRQPLDANGNVVNPNGLNYPPGTQPPPSPLTARAPGAMPGRRNGGQSSGSRYPAAPQNPAQRRLGAIYTNGRGMNARWTGQGWEPVR